MFKFSFELNDDDYLEFNKLHLLANRKFINNWRFLSLSIIAVALLIIWLIMYDKKNEVSLIIVTFLISIYAIYLAFSKRYWTKKIEKSIKKNIENLKKQGKLPYDKENVIQFDEDSFTEITPQKQSKIDYSAVERIVAGEYALYIYTSVLQAVIIPFRVFTGMEIYTEFLEFLQSKILKSEKK